MVAHVEWRLRGVNGGGALRPEVSGREENGYMRMGGTSEGRRARGDGSADYFGVLRLAVSHASCEGEKTGVSHDTEPAATAPLSLTYSLKQSIAVDCVTRVAVPRPILHPHQPQLLSHLRR